MVTNDFLDETYNGLSRAEFAQVLQANEAQLSDYVRKSVPRLHRIFANLIGFEELLSGPTLDIASGSGTLFPAFRHYLPKTLPYAITEIFPQGELEIGGEKIACHKFECDRERLPLDDQSQGLVLFLDVIEHLIVDPMWTILEMNRVLKDGGYVVISTPNAAGAFRALKILMGINPGSEIEYKPAALYQRHNREWTVRELSYVLEQAGFDDFSFTTHQHQIHPAAHTLLQLFREHVSDFVSASKDLTPELAQQIEMQSVIPDTFFGPEILVIAKKVIHRTLDSELTEEQRWPSPLYGSGRYYCRRSDSFPLNVEKY